MKTTFLVFALSWASLASSQNASATRRTAIYANARFEYQVSYPVDFLVPELEADNGDGRAFHARHKAGKALVWGAYRLEDSEPTSAAIARSYEKDCGRGGISYEVIKVSFVAFSCRNGKGGIIYQKTLVGRDVLKSVRVEYPEADRTSWDPVVMQMAASLR